MLLKSNPKFRRSLSVRAHSRYKVYTGKNVSELIPNTLAMIVNPESTNTKVLILTEERVFNLHGKKLIESLKIVDEKVIPFVLKGGEVTKSERTVFLVMEKLRKENFGRGDVIINFGGGTITDVGGFVAAVYKRGLSYINVPTTVLAMADAGLGGKTGIDFHEGKIPVKNMMGVFFQPKAVFCDTEFLDTVDEDGQREGIAEIIKCAVVKSRWLFKSLEKKSIALEKAIYKAQKIKARLIKGDEYDLDKRKLLNFGHTIGQAIESTSDFSVSHGKAVALGMLMECETYERLCLTKSIGFRLKGILKSFDIETNWKKFLRSGKKVSKDYLSATFTDKKKQDEEVPVSIPLKIGRARVMTIPIKEFAQK